MRKIIFYSIVCLPFILSAGCNSESENIETHPSQILDNEGVTMDTSSLTPADPNESYYFPCNDCHMDLEPNTQRRELVEMHDDIVFEHDSESRWCLACHSTNSRDSLILAGGKLLGYNESYKLCGQCHGPKYRDWKLGIHGKRTGEWNGQKEYLLCVHCHDPHSPKFKSISPEPAPRRPQDILIDSTHEASEETSTRP